MEERWWHYWAGHSQELRRFLEEMREIESLAVQGTVETGKLGLIKEKQRRIQRLLKAWACPAPPWREVPANLLWNIHNAPAAQISMMGKITGLTFAPVAACATFGVTLKLAMDAIYRGEAKAVVIGATDPPPLRLMVGAFHNARVGAADGSVSKPMTGLRGTHAGGGAAIWIVGDLDYMRAKGFHPVGMEPLAVGVSSDAEHIITPSKTGPTTAILQALAISGVAPRRDRLVGSARDRDARGLPGGREHAQRPARERAGHGAQGDLRPRHGRERWLGAHRPVPGLSAGGDLSDAARPHRAQSGDRARPRAFRLQRRLPGAAGAAGKLSMGVGGINACVISKPLAE